MPNNNENNEVSWFSSSFKKAKKGHNIENAHKRGVSPVENKTPKSTPKSKKNNSRGGARHRRRNSTRRKV